LFQGTGLDCAFVNAHHHLHVHPSVDACLMRTLPAEFQGWIRMGAPKFFSPSRSISTSGLLEEWVRRRRRRRCRHLLSDSLWGVDRIFQMNAGEVADAARALGAGLHEFMFHPRSVDRDADFRALMELKAMGL
jgi:hypothetical protein